MSSGNSSRLVLQRNLPGLVRRFSSRQQFPVRITLVGHGAEFVHEKRRAMQTGSLLAKEDRPSEGKINQNAKNRSKNLLPNLP